MNFKSETGKIRQELLKTDYLKGDGIDLGCGIDKIKIDMIGFDMNLNPAPNSINAKGEAEDLSRYEDKHFDYVYSSHLLQLFVDTKSVIKEWLRVIKDGGYLILYLPDEQVYWNHCKKTGQHYNNSHKIKDLSLKYMKDLIKKEKIKTHVVKEIEKHMEYSFLIVLKKGEPVERQRTESKDSKDSEVRKVPESDKGTGADK